MPLEILALIVIYGEPALQTTSYRTLVATAPAGVKLRVLLWDNSPASHPPTDVDPAWAERVIYVSTPENIGLSTIYNSVIAEHLRANEFLLILDQDSLLPNDFFLESVKALEHYPEVDLFLPMVRANERWVSPLYYFFGWGRYWSEPRPGLERSSHRTAINSGMLINARYLRSDFPGYDERLKLYGIDTQFMVTYASSRKFFCVMDTTIHHDLSFFSSSTEDKCHKFHAMKAAYRWIYEKHPIKQRVAVMLMMGAVSLLYALRYRSMRFLDRG